MAAIVHGGKLGRWFENLCRIEVPQLRSICRLDQCSLQPNALPNHGGVYSFWWTGKVDRLKSSECNRLLELRGPGGRPVLLELDDEWLGLSTDLPVPLYVGKTSSNIASRIGQHLRLSEARTLRLGEGAVKQRPPTSSCQLRAGVEHLFPREQDTRSLILENVGLSFVDLDGDLNAANRFYLEVMAVGLMRPPLNVDIER